MKRLLVEGWRGVSQSFAMVNQHQLLALRRTGKVALHHADVPFLMPRWSSQETNAGFAPEAAAYIASLTAIDPASADAVYRISAPLQAPDPAAKRTLTFAVTEFGLTDANFLMPAQALSSYTANGNVVVTPSRWSRDRLLDRGFDETGVRVVRHGVDRDLNQPLTEAERALNRKSMGIADDETVFLNIGPPIWNKGIDLLLAAFAELRRRSSRVRLILKDAQKIYGIAVESLVKDLAARTPDLMTADVQSAILVVGSNLSLAEMRLLYGVADCYVSPYRAEGFNLPVLEALACGTPVIVSSGGATDDFCTGDSVLKIPTVFKRGPLGNHLDACWVEPHLPCLIDAMTEAANAGPLHGEAHPSRQAARDSTAQWTWDAAASDLLALL